MADSYNPLIGIIALFLAIAPISKKKYFASLNKIGILFFSIASVYVLMYFDSVTGMWAHMGLDYSTHGALAISITIYLACHHFKSKLLYATTALYFALMLYQEYHTLLDLITTSIVLAPVVYFINRRDIITRVKIT